MRGLLYKYFRQNIILVIITTVLPAIMLVLAMLTGGSLQDFFEEMASDGGSAKLMTTCFLLMGYLITQMVHSGFLNGDEVKKWAYFSVSSPRGVNGVVYCRYLFMAMVSGITFIFMMVFDRVYIYLSSFYLDETVGSIGTIVVFFFFFEMFINAIEMVFNSRYGSAYGGHVKFVLFIAAILILFLLVLFVPLPDSDSVSDAFFGLIIKVLEGDVPNWVLTIIMSFPAFSILCYVASYQISCKLYMKGVECYEK